MEVRYHLRDWIPDWIFVLEQSLKESSDHGSSALKSYFLSRYPDRTEARWRCDRVLAAFRYLQLNGSSFEKGGWAIATSKGGTVTDYLLSALYRFFAIADENGLANPPPPEVFIGAAEEHERNAP
jgi:hypothetical protein